MLHNSNLALAGICISLLFTQSYSHTKSLFSFRNTRNHASPDFYTVCFCGNWNACFLYV